jgi:formylglycine-generating enzyme required for sulfatase activity
MIDNHDGNDWFDKWPANPRGIHWHGWGVMLSGTMLWGSDYTWTFWNSEGRGIARLARTAENICNDITKVKPADDPTLKWAGPVDLKSVTEKIELMPIPAGTYSMGSSTLSSRRKDWRGIGLVSSAPEREVSVPAFQMGKFEVTIQQWRAVRDWAKDKGYSDLPEGKATKASSDDPRHPVSDVSWLDVVKWCNAASEKENRKACYYTDAGKTQVFKTGSAADPVCDWTANGYRLPTEAEWEWAAITGVDAAFYWGDHVGQQYAQFTTLNGPNGAGTAEVENFRSKPVGQKIANRFGLYDTFGNVWEWCWDWTAPYAMALKDTQNPKGPASQAEVAPFFAESKKWKAGKGPNGLDAKLLGEAKSYWGRSVRGGAFDVHSGQAILQDGQQRGSQKPDGKLPTIGFRVVTGGTSK